LGAEPWDRISRLFAFDTSAAELRRRTYDIRTVEELLGHMDVRTTARRPDWSVVPMSARQKRPITHGTA
jgi:hypothetical protein